VLVAIETSTDTGSVALGGAAGVAGEVIIAVRTRHAEALLPALDQLLRESQTTRAAISGIVVGAGPGSFTGVRVAAATARGLAHGLGVPLYAYSSLAAVAVAVMTKRPVCALFDARRGEVYAACYTAGSEPDLLRTILEPTVLDVRALLERMRGSDPQYAGEGAVRYAAELGLTDPPAVPPKASALLRLAAADIAAGAASGRVSHPAGWEPTYLRASGAERGIAG
jgi:tRNA threonylcarbamoyladenosine biosynthesis protein TsaB